MLEFWAFAACGTGEGKPHNLEQQAPALLHHRTRARKALWPIYLSIGNDPVLLVPFGPQGRKSKCPTSWKLLPPRAIGLSWAASPAHSSPVWTLTEHE